MEALVNQWAIDTLDSSRTLNSDDVTFILAYQNVDIDALNAAVRDVRKRRGELGGLEYQIETYRGFESYSVGDRVQFTHTAAKSKFQNGDYGTLVSAGINRWKVQLDSGRVVDFDPRTYKGLRHGYAGTTYKSQGKTLARVLALHDYRSNFKSAYVALTRFKKSMKVFIPQDGCKDAQAFARQISRESQSSSSQRFLSKTEVERTIEGRGSKDEVNLLQKGWISLKDRFHRNSELYTFDKTEKPKKTEVEVSQGLYSFEGLTREQITQNLTHLQTNQFVKEMGGTPTQKTVENFGVRSENALEGILSQIEDQGKGLPLSDILKVLKRASVEKGNIEDLDTSSQNEVVTVETSEKRAEGESESSGQKEQIERIKEDSPPKASLPQSTERVTSKPQASYDLEDIKTRLSEDPLAIISDLLVEPNRSLGTKDKLRFGRKGSLAVDVSGNRKGSWYDFESGEGGDIFKLVAREKGLSNFKDQLEYVGDFYNAAKVTISKLK